MRLPAWPSPLLLLLVLLAGACAHGDREYYPTKPGARRQYRVWGKSQEPGHPELSLDGTTYGSTTLPPRDLNGTEVVPELGESAGQQSLTFVVVGAEGVEIVAQQGRRTRDIVRFPQPSCVLPFPLAVGTTCEVHRPELVGDLEFPVSGTQRVEAVDDTVVVPAGAFRDCIRVRARLTGSAPAPGQAEPASLEADFVQWYAPGVGLVKQIAWKVADPIALGWGTRTMELVSVSR